MYNSGIFFSENILQLKPVVYFDCLNLMKSAVTVQHTYLGLGWLPLAQDGNGPAPSQRQLVSKAGQKTSLAGLWSALLHEGLWQEAFWKRLITSFQVSSLCSTLSQNYMCCAITSHSFIDSSEAGCQHCASAVNAGRTISWKGRHACSGAIQSSKQDECCKRRNRNDRKYRCLESQMTSARAAKERTHNRKKKWMRNTGAWDVVESLMKGKNLKCLSRQESSPDRE